jgi:hypothetical protein
VSRYKLWAIKDPKGKIIQDSVGYMEPRQCWQFLTELDRTAQKIISKKCSASFDDDEQILKNAGYSLVPVEAVEIKRKGK